ncbi:MAG TPA: helix-turn-helix domain-containing protein [Longimicrobiales bacterium]|nr:helix-turn-helix domain-containing protein [Longimicrobiales bacterium]
MAGSGARELAERVHAVAIHLLRRVRGVDAESGLSAARLSALSVLVFGGPRTITELAESEQVTAATMSRLVSGLAGSGLVSRDGDARDRRRVRVVATAAGRAALEAARGRRVDRVVALLSGLGPVERRSVREAVAILEDALGGS